MTMFDSSRYARVMIDRYEFRGFHGCHAFCELEIVRLIDGRTMVLATELEANPGTSITNMCEHLAHGVCLEFSIDPSLLVWIEHYGYPSATKALRPRSYDLVEFEILPAGHDVVFAHPKWRAMKEADWWALGVAPRPPGP